MNIGIDFDGVILDSEERTRFYAEYYSFFELGKRRLCCSEVDQEKCFEWTEEERINFYKKYLPISTESAPFVAGAYEILSKLKKQGHKLYIISRRGIGGQHEVDCAMKKLNNFDIKFDGMYFGLTNKLALCDELNIDLFIDDNPDNVEHLSTRNMQILYFKDIGIKKVNKDNVTQIDDWMDVYHFVNKE